MRREKLEAILDQLFGRQLASPKFLERCVQTVADRCSATTSSGQIQRLTNAVNALRRQRKRVIESYIEGVIERAERDTRLTVIDGDIKRTQDELMQQDVPAGFDVRLLVNYFASLGEWEYWSLEDKRRVLCTLVPDIRVANYQVQSIGLPAALFSNEDTRMDRDSWRRPA
jgi:hypothetical protein